MFSALTEPQSVEIIFFLIAYPFPEEKSRIQEVRQLERSPN